MSGTSNPSRIDMTIARWRMWCNTFIRLSRMFGAAKDFVISTTSGFLSSFLNILSRFLQDLVLDLFSNEKASLQAPPHSPANKNPVSCSRHRDRPGSHPQAIPTAYPQQWTDNNCEHGASKKSTRTIEHPGELSAKVIGEPFAVCNVPRDSQYQLWANQPRSAHPITIHADSTEPPSSVPPPTINTKMQN